VGLDCLVGVPALSAWEPERQLGASACAAYEVRPSLPDLPV